VTGDQLRSRRVGQLIGDPAECGNRGISGKLLSLRIPAYWKYDVYLYSHRHELSSALGSARLFALVADLRAICIPHARCRAEKLPGRLEYRAEDIATSSAIAKDSSPPLHRNRNKVTRGCDEHRANLSPRPRRAKSFDVLENHCETARSEMAGKLAGKSSRFLSSFPFFPSRDAPDAPRARLRKRYSSASRLRVTRFREMPPRFTLSRGSSREIAITAHDSGIYEVRRTIYMYFAQRRQSRRRGCAADIRNAHKVARRDDLAGNDTRCG